MRIKTITCHRAINHGAVLQAFALQTYLQSLGHDVEIIDYCPSLFQKTSLWDAPDKYERLGLGPFYAVSKLPYNLKSRKRAKIFNDFYYRFLKTTERHYELIDELRNDSPKADVYIAGSDQIWNTTMANGIDAAYYLDFGSDKIKRISYAASFATDNLKPGTESFVKEKLKNFDAISVREASGISLLRRLGYTGVQVVDPVFLLNVSDWQSISSHILAGQKEKYILVYDFMRDSVMAQISKRLAKLRNCKIYSIFNVQYADKSFYFDGPETFLELIMNADCVLSNSFHGTSFSLIFKKDFFVVNRSDGLNNRMRDLLDKYDLSSRLINAEVADSVLQSSIDYTNVNNYISNDIFSSKKWINGELPIIQKKR